MHKKVWIGQPYQEAA